MAEMSDQELVALVSSEMENAMGAPTGEISAERAEAWRFFERQPYGDEIEGRSQFVTSEVADVVWSLLPSILRIFTTSDNLVEFLPRDSGDVAQAQQESDYVSWVFFQQNPAFEILYTWAFDGLVQKNGYVKAFWDDREISDLESYQGLTDDQLDALLADEELELIEQEDRTDTLLLEQIVEGVPALIPTEMTVHDVTFRRTRLDGQVVIETMPPEELRISPDARKIDLGRARMVGQEREITRSELLEMGFEQEIIDGLPTAQEMRDSEEEIARRRREEVDDAVTDRSQQKILVQEVYLRVDFDGDGRAELRKVLVAGGELLENEEVDRQPFHVFCPKPLPHKHFGTCPSEDSMDLQRLGSALVRQVLDNLYQTNNPGMAIYEQAMGENTLDDLLTTRVGSYKRFTRPVNEAYAPITVPFTAGATFPFLELLEKMKQTRTGTSTEGQGLTADQLKNIQTNVMAQALDLSRMKIEAIVRVFAETGLKTLFLHIHELLLKHQQQPRIARLRNQWVRVDPREWRTRRNMTVKIGLGIGTREQNLLHLNAIYEKQKDAVEGGGLGVLVTARNLFNTFSELVRNANFRDPETFFTDPGDAPIAPAGGESDRVTELQGQIAQLEAQLRTQEQQIDRERNLLQHSREMEKIALSREKQQNELAVALEQVRNTLTKLELEFRTNVPGSRV